MEHTSCIPNADSLDETFSRLIEEISDKLQSLEPVDITTYCEKHPQYADLLRQLMPSMKMLADIGDTDEANHHASIGGKPLGDFRLIREIGRGGMGVVYEAEQLSLNRRVALKVLPFAAMIQPNHLRRFHNEAQAAACLHHPHIVPVHAVGSDRGIHFYAMQLIEGRSAAELIADQKQRRSTDNTQLKQPTSEVRRNTADGETVPLADLLTLPTFDQNRMCRQIARLGAEAAHALHYAHSQGVIHRDIKPANLLIDQLGSLWITDFGLASVNNDLSLTVSDQLIGTFRYMSPEQAAGIEAIDQRSDVYSLGITIYELLTLKKAVRGETRQAILHEIANVEPTPPTTLLPSISADLETIVLKAIAKEPADRYQSAKQFAEDLERFIQHKPIVAKRPTRLQRVTKWCVRHRYVTAASVAVLCLISIASVVGAMLLSQAYRSESEQRKRAEASLQIAVRAIDQVYGEFVGNELDDTAELTPKQERLLSVAKELYENLAEKTQGDATSWSGYLNVHQQLASIYRRLGQWNQAEATLREAIPAYEKAIRNSSGQHQIKYRGQLASVEEQLATVLVRQGKPDEAEEFYRRSIERLQEITVTEKTIEAVQFNLQSVQHNFAKLLARQGKLDESLKFLAHAETSCRESIDRSPMAIKHSLLGIVLVETATVLRQRDQLDEARLKVQDAISESTTASKLDPQNPTHVEDLASQYYELANMAGEARNLIDEVEARQQAVFEAKRLCAMDPTELTYVANVADAHSLLADALTRAERAKEVEAHLHEAYRILKPFMDGSLDLTNTQRTTFGKAFYNLGNFATRCNQNDQAKELYNRAICFLVDAVDQQNEDTVAREYLAKARYNLGHNIGSGNGDPNEARKIWIDSLDDWQYLVDAHPYEAEYLSRLGATKSNIAQLQINKGEHDRARSLLVEAIKHQEKALTLYPEEPHALSFLRIHKRLLNTLTSINRKSLIEKGKQ